MTVARFRRGALRLGKRQRRREGRKNGRVARHVVFGRNGISAAAVQAGDDGCLGALLCGGNGRLRRSGLRRCVVRNEIAEGRMRSDRVHNPQYRDEPKQTLALS